MRVEYAEESSARSSKMLIGDLPARLGNTNLNHFLLLDLRRVRELPDSLLAAVSMRVCYSPFVDDVIVLGRSKNANARFRVFGGDGREASFCGNGALFALHCLAQEGEGPIITLESRQRIYTGIVGPREECRLEFDQVQDGRGFMSKTFARLSKEYGVKVLGAVVAGEPHLVLSAPNQKTDVRFCRHRFERMGREFCDAAHWEGGVNVTVVFQHTMRRLSVRTFERGARRMTASCGSGAIAAASILWEQDNPSGSVEIASPGGYHKVQFDSRTQRWRISGKVCEVGQASVADILDVSEIEEMIQNNHMGSATKTYRRNTLESSPKNLRD